jgi:hypothetical protein
MAAGFVSGAVFRTMGGPKAMLGNVFYRIMYKVYWHNLAIDVPPGMWYISHLTKLKILFRCRDYR